MDRAIAVARDALDGRGELVDADRFDEVIRESNRFTALQIGFHSKAAERDPLDHQPAALANLFHQVIAGRIRQADVADHDVEWLVASQVQRGCDTARGLYMISRG